MPAQNTVLGSLAIQAPSIDQQRLVHVNASTCANLSLFKDLLKEYRKLDDTIVMRMNRTNALFRDQERQGTRASKAPELHDNMCLYIWRELVDNWKRRADIIDYCVGVMDTSMTNTQQLHDESSEDPSTQRKLKAQLYSSQVQQRQIRNELTVEQIIRARSLKAFLSRCQYFSPPENDTESRKWWNATRSS